MRDLPDPLLELLRRQHNCVTRAQAVGAGVTPAQLRAAVRARYLRPVLPGVLTTSRAPLQQAGTLIAAALYAGQGAVLTSSAAARLHGLTTAPKDARLHFAVPAHRAARSFGDVVVRRTTRPDERAVETVAPLHVACVTRSVADAARDAQEREAIAIVLEAVQRRLVSPEDLREELLLGPRWGSRALRKGIEAAEARAWSVPELDLATLLGRSRVLPQMWANPRLTTAAGERLPTPDGWFDDVALAIQVHSVTYHYSVEDWEKTMASDNGFGRHGITCLAFTPRQIRTKPSDVLATVEATYRRLQGRPRPAVQARRR